MKHLFLVLFALVFSACTQPQPEIKKVEDTNREAPVEIELPSETGLSVGKDETEEIAPFIPLPEEREIVSCPKVHPCAPCPKEKPCKPIIIYKEPSNVIIGELEEVYLPVYKAFLKGRIDTGAQTSSVHAKEIVPFERDGEKWVRFKVIDNQKGEIQIKKPIVKTIKVKRHGEESQERYVVHMRLNVSSMSQYIEVSLTDREQYKYPVLIGRNFLQGNALVDVNRRYTKAPTKDSK